MAMSETDIKRAALEAGIDPRTALRLLTDGRGSKATRKLLVDALRKLGFEADARRVERAA